MLRHSLQINYVGAPKHAGDHRHKDISTKGAQAKYVENRQHERVGKSRHSLVFRQDYRGPKLSCLLRHCSPIDRPASQRLGRSNVPKPIVGNPGPSNVVFRAHIAEAIFALARVGVTRVWLVDTTEGAFLRAGYGPFPGMGPEFPFKKSSGRSWAGVDACFKAGYTVGDTPIFLSLDKR